MHPLSSPEAPRPVFGQPGWRRRLEEHYGWDKEFKAAALILILIVFSLALVRADDGGALPGDDPKDYASGRVETTEVSTTSSNVGIFLPLPDWSHDAKMPVLPDVLKPMGKSPAMAAKPSPAALAETKPDGAPPPKPAPKPAADPNAPSSATLIAISPFLQWIKDHPKEAVAEARRQAASDAAALTPGAPSGPDAGGDPYWMPPMIDSSTAPANPPTVEAGGGGGSAAIYSTPQR